MSYLDDTLCAELDQTMSDEEFKELKNMIRMAWSEYDALQKRYQSQTGIRYKWFGNVRG